MANIYQKIIITLLMIFMALFSFQCKKKNYAKKVVLKQITATSQLDNELKPYKYNALYLLDGDGSSSWCEGKDDKGFGEAVNIYLKQPILFNRIYLTNGYSSQVKKRKSNEIDVKRSMKYFQKNAAIPSKIVIKVGFSTAKNKDEYITETLTVPTDKPVVTLMTKKELGGDKITIILKDIYYKGRSRSGKNDTCMTDIAFGLVNNKENIKYENLFEYKGNEKKWADYWDLAHKENAKHISTTAYWYYCLSKPENPCESRGYLRGLDIYDGPDGKINPKVIFNWKEEEIAYRIFGEFFDSKANAVKINVQETNPDSRSPEPPEAVAKPLNLKPAGHSKEEGLILIDEETGSKVIFRWLTSEERKEKNIKVKDLAAQIGERGIMNAEGFDPANFWNYVIELSLEPADPSEENFKPVYYLVAKAK